MKMKKMAGFVLSAALLLGVLAGCGSSKDAAANDSAAVSGTVSTNGSTSMEKVIGILSEQYMADNSGVTITYDATGSGTGIEAVANGTCDIGLASRGLKDTETGLTATTIALDGIAVVVNENCGVDDLSLEDVAAIYSRELA